MDKLWQSRPDYDSFKFNDNKIDREIFERLPITKHDKRRIIDVHYLNEQIRNIKKENDKKSQKVIS